MRKHEKLNMVLVLFLALTLILGGCNSKNSLINSNFKTNNSQELKTTTKVFDEISIFYGTAGITVPDGVSLSDNPFINKIAELANVKFSRVTVPAYTDFQTKFNLMVSSGDVPDLVHCWFPEDVQQLGNGGVFLDWSSLVKKSSLLSNVYNEQMLEIMKDDKGRIFALRSIGAVEPSSNAVRKDLIDEVNNGIIPTNPEGWYEVFKKIKYKYPDSTPYSSAGGLWGLDLFFKAYGVAINSSGSSWQYTNGKVISAFEAPLCKEAVLFHNKLYSEGLLDKNFVTNKLQDYIFRKYNNKVMIAPNGIGSIMTYIGHYAKNTKEDAIIVPGPQPIVKDSRIDIINVYSPLPLLGIHCVAISSKTKKTDAVIRVIEALLSAEMRNASAWGREGLEYKIENGQKKLDIKNSNETLYRRIYGFMYSYWTDEIIKTTLEEQLNFVEASKRSNYTLQFNTGVKLAYDEAAMVSAVTPMSFVQLSPDTFSKQNEALELSKSIIIKAIIGEINMLEYDLQVANYLRKYKTISDEYNEKVKEAKLKLKK